MDPLLAAHLPSAADVDGPTIQPSFNVVQFENDEETVGSLLLRMKADQDMATRYECTPLSLALGYLSEPDRTALMERGLSQLFNWLPSGRHMGLNKLHAVRNEMNADTGLHWDFTYVNVSTVELFVRWDGCHLRSRDVESMLDDIESAALWLSESGCWERRLSERVTQSSYRVWRRPDSSSGEQSCSQTGSICDQQLQAGVPEDAASLWGILSDSRGKGNALEGVVV